MIRVKAWQVQIVGILALSFIFLLAIPFFTKEIPEKFQQHLSQDLKQQGYDWVKVSVNGRNVMLTGNAPNHEVSNAALKVTQQYAPIIKIENEMTPRIIQPYSMRMSWNGNELSLEGYLPHQENKNELMKIAQQATTANPLEDTIKIGAGAPPNWSQLVSSSLKKLITLQHGRVEITNQSIYFSGQTPSSAQRDEIKQQLAQYQQYQTTLNIIVIDEADKICKTKFKQLLSHINIQFAENSAILSQSSYPFLSKLANTILLCPNANIKIAGYTDNIGDNKANLYLSQLRAESVANWLFKKGIHSQQLTTVGYGKSNPIADNERVAGRAANRRIEFIIGK
jgi:OOP family OmpA-OmpF porin